MYWRKTTIIFSVFVFSCSAPAVVSTDDEAEKTITSLPYYHTPDFMPAWQPDQTDSLHRVADFSFINHSGEQVTSELVKGKIYLVNFFFSTCSGICPKMMRNMEKVQNEFAENEEVLFLSHTVMPWIDSVEALDKYAANFNVSEGRWHLLTGNKSEIYDLARTSYFVEEEPGYTKDSTEFLHTEHFVLVDREGHLRGLYNGTVELEMERIIEDIKLLLKEEKQNQ